MHTHTRTHECTYTRAIAFTHTRLHKQTNKQTNKHTHARTHTHTHTRTHTHIRQFITVRLLVHYVPIDIGVVNCLAVDWVAKLLFWTDEWRQTIEVADYEGRYRKTIIDTGLRLPRGIATDPSTGYVVSNNVHAFIKKQTH